MGHIIMGIFALFVAFQSLLVDDVFLDESESPPVTDPDERARLGIKATRLTKTLMVTLFTGIAAWQFWEFFSKKHR